MGLSALVVVWCLTYMEMSMKAVAKAHYIMLMVREGVIE